MTWIKNGWEHTILQHASDDFDMMMAFDWAARQYYCVDNDSDLYDQEFYINAKGLKDKNGKLPYGYHGMLIKDAAYMVYQQVLSGLMDDLGEISWSKRNLFIIEMWLEETWGSYDSNVEEAFQEFLSAYETLTYENIFEEAVHQQRTQKNGS